MNRPPLVLLALLIATGCAGSLPPVQHVPPVAEPASTGIARPLASACPVGPRGPELRALLPWLSPEWTVRRELLELDGADAAELVFVASRDRAVMAADVEAYEQDPEAEPPAAHETRVAILGLRGTEWRVLSEWAHGAPFPSAHHRHVGVQGVEIVPSGDGSREVLLVDHAEWRLDADGLESYWLETWIVGRLQAAPRHRIVVESVAETRTAVEVRRVGYEVIEGVVRGQVVLGLASEVRPAAPLHEMRFQELEPLVLGEL